jgi:hypothetical protein
MTDSISQRGKECLETARTLLRAAQSMTDQAVACRLKALAEGYERRAREHSLVDASKAFARSASGRNGIDANDLMDEFADLQEVRNA